MVQALVGAGMVVAVVIVWKVAVNMTKAKHRVSECARLAANMEVDEAEEAAGNSIRIVVAQLADPMGCGIPPHEADFALELAVACYNRMSQLEGSEYGPAYKARLRIQLLFALRRKAEELSAGRAYGG